MCREICGSCLRALPGARQERHASDVRAVMRSRLGWRLGQTWREALVIAWLVAGSAALAQAQAGAAGSAGPAARVPAPPAASQAPASGAGAIRQAAEQRGFGTCGARVEQVANFLGFGPAAGAYLMFIGNSAGKPAEQRLLPLVMEIPLGPTSAITSTSFAQTPSGGCSATYDAIVYWPQPCDGVAQAQFGSLRRLGLLKRDVLVLDGGPATKVFLMAAGAGCLSVKKEVVL